jgi:(p)ppGpp synthase/HD superfamily hydrolase
MSDPLVEKASAFAIAAHEGIHQTRSTGEPYWTHPQSVAGIVSEYTSDPEVIAAAWLHDTVEDTPTTLETLKSEFGPRVASLVDDLTNVAPPDCPTREQKITLNREHSAKASPDAKTVKLADVLHNLSDADDCDKDWARKYIREKKLLLEVLKEGDSKLWARVKERIDFLLEQERYK